MSSLLLLVLAIAIVAVCAWASTGLARLYAIRNGILDIPNRRSSHVTPTARGGGVAIVGVFLVGLAILASRGLLEVSTAIVLAVAGSAIALVGHLDDRKALPARIRLGVHFMAATLVVSIVGGVSDQSLRLLGLQGAAAGCVVGVLGLVWSTNLFNFMDGIDGIAGSEAVFVASAGAWLNYRYGADAELTLVMLVLAAATLGFLVWNWPPARIFMGDVGSGFLGFMLAGFGLLANQKSRMPIEVWAILAGVFLVDATVTLLRRVLRGERWFEAHRLHAYQRLAVRCNAHLPVTLLVLGINICWLLPWASFAAQFPERARLFFAAALAPLVVVAFALGAGSDRK